MFSAITSVIHRIRIKFRTTVRKWRRGVEPWLEPVRQNLQQSARRVGRSVRSLLRQCWKSTKFRRLLADVITDFSRKLVRKSPGSPWFALADILLTVLAANLKHP